MRSFFSFLLAVISVLLALIILGAFFGLVFFFVNLSGTATFERKDKKPPLEESPVE